MVYERLGALYEERGNTEKATYYYGKLVELWKDADPELQPRVEAARRTVSALSPDRLGRSKPQNPTVPSPFRFPPGRVRPLVPCEGTSLAFELM